MDGFLDSYHAGKVGAKELKKAKITKEFLEDGDKVQVNMMFRGRELAHIEVGRQVVDRFATALDDIAKMERPPIFEGKRMTCLMTRR